MYAGCSAAAPNAGGWTPAGQRLHHGAAQNGTAGPPSKPDSQHGNPLFGQVCPPGVDTEPQQHVLQLHDAIRRADLNRVVLGRGSIAQDSMSLNPSDFIARQLTLYGARAGRGDATAQIVALCRQRWWGRCTASAQHRRRTARPGGDRRPVAAGGPVACVLYGPK